MKRDAPSWFISRRRVRFRFGRRFGVGLVHSARDGENFFSPSLALRRPLFLCLSGFVHVVDKAARAVSGIIGDLLLYV